MTGGSTVLVTGATGFIGRAVCAELARAGHHVRAATRSANAPIPQGTERALVADLCDADAVRAALDGVDAVVHAAGRAHVLRERSADPQAAFDRVNVEGTRAVAAQAARSGVRRLVHVSSIAAIEDAARGSALGAYARSKRASEEVVLSDELRAAGLLTTVLRPPMVYGPGMRGNPLRLMRYVESGVPLPLGSVHNRRSVLFVGNLAAAVRAALGSDAVHGRRFVVADRGTPSTPEFAAAMARALGRPLRLVGCPPALLRAAGVIGDALGPHSPIPISSAAIAGLVDTAVHPTAEFEEAAAFTPPYTLDEGMAITARWYRERGGE